MFENVIRDLLFSLFSSRLSVGVVGILFAALITAAFSRLIPWWLFAVALVVLIGGSVAWAYLSQWWAERKDTSLEKGLEAQNAKEIGRQRVRDREAIKELQVRWKESVEQLKKSRIGRKRKPLYFLPWYVIIGAPACGKSTAIKNSGLHFPMGEPKLAGTGGTRNCDWWFAEEAIILDTAGRYTFHDEHEPDREEWLTFLKLLRKYRPQQPINGLIVAVSADRLMTGDVTEVTEDARAIRHKIDQLTREFGIQFPIYLLVTKCDLIEGFTDFFGRLPKSRLDEMLGWTNPKFDTDDHRKMIAEAVDAIYQRIVDMRTGFLWEEERPEILRRIFLFPEEMRSFNGNLEAFGDILFRETQYNESPFLRGIYLTSGMQSGTSISRMIERLGVKLAVTDLPEQKRSFFLKDLFQVRLGADRSMVASTGRARGRLQAINNIGFAAAASACVLFAALVSTSYFRNRTLLNDVQDAVEGARSAQNLSPEERIAGLSDYVTYLEQLDALNQSRPLLAGFGLYMGDRAYEPARQLFLASFDEGTYRPTTEAARTLVRQRDLDRGFVGLSALIRNLVLSRDLNGSTREATGSNESLVEIWTNGQAITPGDLSNFDHAYFTFLRWRPAEAATSADQADLALLRQALPEMMTVPNVARWADRTCPPFNTSQAKIPAEVSGGSEVRGAFTAACWSGRVEPLIGVADLVAREIDPALIPAFQKSYVAQTFDAWRGFLLSTRIAPEGALPLPVLLGDTTPYAAVVDAVASGASIEVPDGERPAWVSVVKAASGQRGEYLGVLKTIGREVSAGSTDRQLALSGTRTIFSNPAVTIDGSATVDGAAGPAQDAFGKALQLVARTVSGDGLESSDADVRRKLGEILSAPVYDAWAAYVREAAQEIDRLWRGRIVNPVSNARTPDDIYPIYSKDGPLGEFVRQYVSPFVDGPPSYTPKVRYTKAMPIRSDLGPFLNRAPSNPGPPKKSSVRFEARPTGNPPGDLRAIRTILTITCEENEWVLEHRQFPANKTLAWTPEKCQRVELQVWVGSGRGSDERPLDPLVFSGPTALESFLRRSRSSGGTFTWNVEGFTPIFVISGVGPVLEGDNVPRPPTSIVR